MPFLPPTNADVSTSPSGIASAVSSCSSPKRAAGLRNTHKLLAGSAAILLGYLSSAHAAHTTLTWGAAPESDVVGYRVHYGLTSGKYDKTLDVGNVTKVTLPDLNPGNTYFFSVTAYSRANIESLPSKEASRRVQGEATANTAAKATNAETSNAQSDTTSGAEAGTNSVSTAVGSNVVSSASGVSTTSSSDTVGSTDSSTTLPTSGDSVAVAFSKGVYSGLVTAKDSTPKYLGLFNLSTTPNGAFTGKIALKGVNYAVRGRFDSAGTASVKIAQKGGSQGTLSLQFSEAGKITGTLSVGTQIAELSSDRAAGTNGSKAASHAGKWTVLLPVSGEATAGSSNPKGVGFGTVLVSKTGFARINGTLADGTPISYGASISEQSEWPVYVPIYKNKGAFAGSLKFSADAEQGGSISGAAEWTKSAGISGAKYYPSGFELQLDAVGEKYVQPTGAQIGFANGQASGAIELSGGNLATAISKAITLTKAGKVSVAESGTDRLKLQLNIGSGTFTGTFFDTAAKKSRRFAGALLQSQSSGAGFFLGTDESGLVTIGANE